MYAQARVQLGVQEAEFWDLTPRELEEMFQVLRESMGGEPRQPGFSADAARSRMMAFGAAAKGYEQRGKSGKKTKAGANPKH